MSDLVRVGTNEDGEEIIREKWYLVAESARGYRFAASILFGSKSEAYDRRDEVVRDGGVDPLRSGWFRMSSVYGSEAYVESGDEAAYAAEERRRDEEAY